ncbi:hypothetical protein [Streptomyces sp. NPDC016845]|uniref:hypothetical protein n=1 Tax=Streptomyces sp. NPDC016845 TaxID=3364972 RepID=UPI0037B025C7
MTDRHRLRVWLALIGAGVAISGTLAGLFATDTIGGDQNRCSNRSVCGHGNTTDFGPAGGAADQERARAEETPR